jgi:hypothetical protein
MCSKNLCRCFGSEIDPDYLVGFESGCRKPNTDAEDQNWYRVPDPDANRMLLHHKSSFSNYRTTESLRVKQINSQFIIIVVNIHY